MQCIGCKHKDQETNAPRISYFNDVKPVLIGHCSMKGCHGAEEPEKFDVLAYQNLFEEELVVPGKPYESELYKSITGRGEEMMPPTGYLHPQNIDKIFLWIKQGAKNN